MENVNQIFFELIQVAIGRRKDLSHMPTAKEWEKLYFMAESQAILGICFVGVKRLLETHNSVPKPLFLQWLAMSIKIVQHNEDMDRKTAEIWSILDKAGLCCAVLKGQGLADYYKVGDKSVDSCLEYTSLANLRQSGDIDVWVKGGFNVVNSFVQQSVPSDEIAYHRFHYNIYKDTEVELHHRPTLMRNLVDDRRLQKWCNSFGGDTFLMTDKGFAVPSIEFNRIFILTHIYRHFLFEGIGLRQLMDYYFVLSSQRPETLKVTEECLFLSKIKMMRFAAAVMWVLNYVFGLDRDYLLCDPDEKEGRFVLSEIMSTGNFGCGDKRYRGYSKWRRLVKHGSHLILHYPSEVIWTPVWLVFHKVWKISKRRKISISNC